MYLTFRFLRMFGITKFKLLLAFFAVFILYKKEIITHSQITEGIFYLKDFFMFLTQQLNNLF